jgi:hypothetical protein
MNIEEKRLKEKKRLNLYYINLKTLVLEHYGSVCACCGESRLVFLSIDHIGGGGNKHRQTLPGGCMIYRFLKKTGYPQGYQVLCWNCNWAKHILGTCPHQTERN